MGIISNQESDENRMKQKWTVRINSHKESIDLSIHKVQQMANFKK